MLEFSQIGIPDITCRVSVPAVVVFLYRIWSWTYSPKLKHLVFICQDKKVRHLIRLDQLRNVPTDVDFLFISKSRGILGFTSIR